MTTPAAHRSAVPDPTHLAAPPGRRVAPTTALLDVHPLPDPVIDRIGHDPRSPYAERFWLAVLGPTSLLLMRHLAGRFDDQPDGFELERAAAARSLGVSSRMSRNAPFVRALARCGQFGLIQRPGPDILYVRRRMPPLTRAQVRQLPHHLERSHQRWQQAQLGAPDRTAVERARRSARALLELGESPAEVRRLLERGGIESETARGALAWAVQRPPSHDGRPTPPTDAA